MISASSWSVAIEMEASPAVAPAAVEELESQIPDESQEVSLEEKEKRAGERR